MGVSEQFPARLLSKHISSTFFSRSSRGRLVVALVFRVLLVAGLQDDRPPDGRAQVDGARRHVRDVRPRVGPRAARPGPAPRQHRAVRLPRDDGTARRPGQVVGARRRRHAHARAASRRPAGTARRSRAAMRSAGPRRRRRCRTAARPGRRRAAPRPRRTGSRRRASAACTPRSDASPSSAFAVAAPARLSITTKAEK